MQLAQRFAGETIAAIGLTGSFARGDAGPYSDVDLLRLARTEEYDTTDKVSHWIDDRLVNVSTLTPSGIEAIFTDPGLATQQVAGLRDVRILIDSDGHLERLHSRAVQFAWDDNLQQQANVTASRDMVGWAEEAYKGLEGLRRDDPARLLQARFGCTWGLSSVIRVQRGILLASDNDVIAAIDAEMADEPEWVRLRHRAFGLSVDGHTTDLRQQVEAGLRLYVATAILLEPVFEGQDRELIWAAVDRIRSALEMEQP